MQQNGGGLELSDWAWPVFSNICKGIALGLIVYCISRAQAEEHEDEENRGPHQNGDDDALLGVHEPLLGDSMRHR